MANTVNILGFANTFGDWVVATNADSNEINSIGKYDWTKDSGTLILNGTGTSLTVGNNAIVAGQLQVTGTSSSATIDNNLTVGKQVYFTNTTQSLVSSGRITSNGTIFATNTGTSLSVSNNSTLAGTLTVSGTTIISNTINVLGAATLQNSLSVGAGALITGNTSITGNTYTSFLTSNNRINAGQLSVTSNGDFGGSIIATVSAVVNGYDVISYILGAFTQANSAYGSQNVTGTYANSAYYTANSAQLYANGAFLKANSAYGSQNTTGTYANSAYEAANSAGVYANGAFLKANSAYGSQNTTGTYANAAFLFANNLQSGAQTFNNMTLTGTSLTATNAIGAFQSLTTSASLAVGGSFVLNGTVVYTTNNFVINANTNTPIISYFSVNRGTANNQPNGIPNANASIRWNESNKYFDIVDVNNGTQYSQIMTANMISDSTTSTSTATVPTNKVLTGAFTQANAAFTQANSAYGSQNTTGTYANSAYLAANNANANAITSGAYANSAFGAANTAALSAAPAFTQANGAFTQANAAFIFANSSSSTLSSSITAAGSYANSGYYTANVAYVNALTADSKAVTAGSYANSAFLVANNAATSAAASYANSAFITANNALPRTGGTLSGDLGITGNLFVNGTSSYINVSTFQTVDSLIELAANNLSDTIDIGFYGQYASVGTKYAGLVRKAGSSYFLFQDITSNPTSNSVGTISYANYGTLNANISAGQITSSQPIPVTSGGTGVTSSTGTGNAVLSSGFTITSGTINSTTINTSTLVGPALGTPISGNLSNCTFPTLNQNTSGTAAGLSATLAVASGGTGVTSSTGTGSVVLSSGFTITSGTINSTTINSPSLVTPALGTPSSGNLSNCTFPTLNQNTTGNAATATNATNATNVTGVSGTLGYSTSGITVGTSAQAGPMVQSTGGGAAVLSFHRPGSYAINMGLDTDNSFKWGGWSNGGNTFRMQVDASGNLTAAGIMYAVQFSGSGAGLTNIPGANVTGTVGDCSRFSATNQDSQFNSIGIGTGAPGGGNLRASGNITAYYSDNRLKTKLGNITGALSKVKSLNGFYYEANQTAQDLGYEVKREVGVSAQEVQLILPEIVSPAPIDAQYLTIDYERLVPLLIEAIKELSDQVEELKAKLP
jgi:hypothetical protein